MRTAIGVTVGAALTWCIIAIWRGPTMWLFTRIPVLTPADHLDRVRVWHNHIEQAGASWPE